MQLTLTVRDLEPADLADLDWSGGPEHLAALATAWQQTLTGAMAVLVVALDNGRLVAHAAVDLSTPGGPGVLSVLAVEERFQGLGLGSALVAALEARARESGRTTVRITVEHDNPRAAALYRRLGYAEVGSVLETWPTSGGRHYVTVSTVLQKALGPERH